MKPPIVEVTYSQTIEPIEVTPEVAERIRKIAEEIQADLFRAMLVSGIAVSELKVDVEGRPRFGIINWDNMTS